MEADEKQLNPVGRPSFRASEQMRAQVRAMAAYGIPRDEIAATIGCGVDTMRKYFSRELEVASAEANAKVAQSLFKRATEGTGKEAVTACIFWLKCRAGWREVSETRSGRSDTMTAAEMDWSRDLDVRPAAPN